VVSYQVGMMSEHVQVEPFVSKDTGKDFSFQLRVVLFCFW